MQWSGASKAARLEIFLVIVGTLTILSFTAYLLFQSLNWPMVDDAPLLNYSAKLILAGLSPYRDFLDMNFPGTMVFHMGVMSLGLAPAKATMTANALLLVLLGCILARTISITSKDKSLWRSTMAACAFILTCLALRSQNALQRETVVLCFVATGFLISIEADTANSWLVTFASCACIAAASTIKPQAVFFFLALAPQQIRRDNFSKHAVRLIVTSLLSLTLIWGGLLYWLHSLGSLESFIRFLIRFTVPIYSSFNRDWTSSHYAHLLSIFRSEFWGRAAWACVRWLALVLLTFEVLGANTKSRIRVVGPFLIAGVLYFYAQFKGWPYHSIPANYFAIVLIFGFPLGEFLQKIWPRLPRVELIEKGLLAICCAVFLKIAVPVGQQFGDLIEATVAELTAALEQDAANGKRIQFFDTYGGGANALLRLGVRAPTAMIYDFMLFLPYSDSPVINDFSRSIGRRLLQEILLARPEVLVFFNEGWPGGDGDRWKRIPELSLLIEQQYLPAEKHRKFQIFRINSKISP